MWSGAARGVEVRLTGDRLTLRARAEPLTDVLRGLAQAGVRIKLDPGVQRSITAEYTDADVEKTLGHVLAPFSHVLTWKVIAGPLGAFPRLDEIQVFRPGQQDLLQLLPGPGRRLAVEGGAGKGPRYVKDEVLLGFRPGTRRADALQLLQKLGGTIVGSVPALGVYQIRFAPGTSVPDVVAQLSKNPLVAGAEPNYVTGAFAPVPLPAAGALPANSMTPAVPAGAPAVAVLDSGLSPSAALGNAVIAQLDATQPDQPLTDTVGHGTQMALIATGAVSPLSAGETAGTPLVAIRVFDDQGLTSNYDLMLSINYALSQGARVLNMSWGTDTPSAFLASAVAYAQSKDAVVVSAAGNVPNQQPVYPAAYPGVLAVGALGPDGQLWDQSNQGDFVALTAPGVANFPVGYQGPPGAYVGTSIASAYVAHAMALYLAKHPTATAAAAQSALLAAVTDAGAPGKDAVYGYGTLDGAALSRLLQ
jgi:hypothetical protein